MTDEDALIAAILAELKEDTPRLMYADWLDEFAGGGRFGVRAEFIRVGCELYALAHTRRQGNLAEFLREFDRLGTREFELAETIYKPAIPAGYKIITMHAGGSETKTRMAHAKRADETPSVSISRGFAVRLTLALCDWRLAWSFNREPVRAIKIHGTGVGYPIAGSLIAGRGFRSYFWQSREGFPEFSGEFSQGLIPWEVYTAGIELVDKLDVSVQPGYGVNHFRYMVREFDAVADARTWLSDAMIAWSRKPRPQAEPQPGDLKRFDQ